MDPGEPPLSSSATSPGRFWVAVALLSVIPLLVFAYVAFPGYNARADLADALACVIAVVLGLTGYVILRHYAAALSSIRDQVDKLALVARSPAPVAPREPGTCIRLDPAKLESLTAMATGIAHDFNNYLAAILGNLTLVHKALGDSPGAEHAQHAEQIAGRAVRLANELLLFAGRARFTPGNVDLNTLAAEQDLAALVPASIRLDLHPAPDLPTFTGDVSQIRQALAALVVNAIDSCQGKPGVIEITTGKKHAGPADFADAVVPQDFPEDDYAWVEIADRGRGVSPQSLASIFDPFYSTKIRGHGMGLPVVLGVMRAHAGALKCSSRLDEGSRFTLYFQIGRVIIDPL